MHLRSVLQDSNQQGVSISTLISVGFFLWELLLLAPIPWLHDAATQAAKRPSVTKEPQRQGAKVLTAILNLSSA